MVLTVFKSSRNPRTRKMSEWCYYTTILKLNSVIIISCLTSLKSLNLSENDEMIDQNCKGFGMEMMLHVFYLIIPMIRWQITTIINYTLKQEVLLSNFKLNQTNLKNLRLNHHILENVIQINKLYIKNVTYHEMMYKNLLPRFCWNKCRFIAN